MQNNKKGLTHVFVAYAQAAVISDPVEYPYLMVKEAEEAEGAEGAGEEVFWLGCLIMVNHPDLI